MEMTEFLLLTTHPLAGYLAAIGILLLFAGPV
jgi:hypothetical protein